MDGAAIGKLGVRGDQFGLLGVALQLLEEEKTSPVTGHLCVALELKPPKSWFSLQ